MASSVMIQDNRNNTKTILLVSSVTGVILFLLAPITYFSVSDGYLRYAHMLLGAQDDDPPYFRSPGLPLLMILTGVIHLDTFMGLVMLQLLMAIATPLFIYKIIAFYDHETAYYASLLSIFSLIPFGYMKAVLTEGPYIFTLLVAIYLASCFLKTRKLLYMYLLAFPLFFLLLLRPSANYLYVVVLVALAVLSFKSSQSSKLIMLHALLACGIVLVLSQGWNALRSHLMVGPGMAASSFNPTNAMGKQLFYNVYLGMAHSDNDALLTGDNLSDGKTFIRPEDGPASKRFVDTLRTVLTPENIAKYKQGPFPLRSVDTFFFKDYENEPEALLKQILVNPSAAYYFFLWQLLDHSIGPAQADSLLLELSLEMLSTRPTLGMVVLVRNLYFFAAGIPIDYVPALHPNYNLKVMQPNLAGLVAYTPFRSDGIALSERQLSELRLRWGDELNSRARLFLFYYLWSPLFLVIRPFVFLMMVCGVVILRKTRFAPIAILSFLVVMYHMSVVCIFVVPIDRYVMHSILVEWVVAAPAFVSGLAMIRRQPSPPIP